MRFRVLETLLSHMNFTYVHQETPEPEEPFYAREIAVLILKWKKCPRCQELFSTDPSHLEFLTANRSWHSESYRTICGSGHRVFVTLFPLRTLDMFSQSQNEVIHFLPKKCGPNREIKTPYVFPIFERRGDNERIFKRTCGVSTHDHDEYVRYYEKPGWELRGAIF